MYDFVSNYVCMLSTKQYRTNTIVRPRSIFLINAANYESPTVEITVSLRESLQQG